jgi:hypothetical protein
LAEAKTQGRGKAPRATYTRIGVIKPTMSIVAIAPTETSNDDPRETNKLLIGWTNDQFAIEARSSMITDTIKNHMQEINACRATIASRSAFVPTNPITEIEENALIKEIKTRPEIYQITSGLEPHFTLVNLKEILTFQPLVRIDNLESRVGYASLSQEQLYELCFPSAQLVSPIEINVLPDDRGFVVHTLNPNFRVVPWHSIDSPLISRQQLPNIGVPFHPTHPPIQVPLLPYVLIGSPNYLQVAHYEDRYFLRDGHHRAAGFLKQKIERIPCILIEAQNFPQIGWRPGMIDQEILMGDHPPRLSDFWDNSVSCFFKRPALRRVYRISMEELNIPR